MTPENKSNPNQFSNQSQNKDKGKSARELENEIGATRSAISSDIKALNEKFTPAAIKDQAKDAVGSAIGGAKDAAIEQATEIKDVVVDKAIEVKDAVVEKATEIKDVAVEKMGEAKDIVVDTMENVGDGAMRAGAATWRFTKANAVPLALIGVSAGWMIANSRRSNGSQLERPYSSDRPQASWDDDTDAAYSGRAGARPRRRPASRLEERSPAANDPTVQSGQQKSKSSRMADGARDMMDKAGDALVSAEHKVADSASRSTAYVSDKFQRAGTATRDFAVANPLLMAMATLAAGVGIGMLLPSTERETKLLGPSRAKFQNLIGDVREAATDVAQVAKDTASESMQAMR